MISSVIFIFFNDSETKIAVDEIKQLRIAPKTIEDEINIECNNNIHTHMYLSLWLIICM